METPIPAFGAYGIELEYAIVDRDTLDVAPLAANLLERVAACTRIAGAPVGWSNEIVEHVAEVKNVDGVSSKLKFEAKPAYPPFHLEEDSPAVKRPAALVPVAEGRPPGRALLARRQGICPFCRRIRP